MGGTSDWLSNRPKPAPPKTGDSMTAAGVEQRLSNTLQTKLDEVKAIQRQADTARADVEQSTAAERKAHATKQEALLNQMLQAQVEEQTARAQRQGLWNKVLAGLVTLMTVVGGAIGIVITRVPTAEQKAEAAKPVTETVTKAGDQIEERIKKNDKKIERLGELYIEGQVTQSDDGEYTRALIRAAHSRSGDALDAVPVPPTVKAAKTMADAVKKKREDNEFAKPIPDMTDPFAGIDD